MESSFAAKGAHVRVFISYAHDTPEHIEAVARLSDLLSSSGIEVHLDTAASTERLDWTLWMTSQLQEADYVLVIASPEYRLFAEQHAKADQRRGVQWEARLIREAYYANYGLALRKYLPVLLPGGSVDDIPGFMAPRSAMHFALTDLTFEGLEELYRILTGQGVGPREPLGSVRRLPGPPLTDPAGSPGSGRTAPEVPLVGIDRRRFLLATGAVITASALTADGGIDGATSSDIGMLADKVAATADNWRLTNGDLAARIDLAAFEIDQTQMAANNLMRHSLIKPLTGFQGSVESVFFHPSQNLLVAGGEDGYIHTWDIDSGKHLQYRANNGYIFAVAFDRSGELLASGGDDNTAIIWKWVDQKPVFMYRLYGHTASVFRLAFSPISNLLATGGVDGRVFLWNPETGKQVGRELDHSGASRVGKWVWGLAFHSKKEALATAGDDPVVKSLIRLWDLSTPAYNETPIPAEFLSGGAIAFSPDYPDMLVSTDSTGRIFYTNIIDLSYVNYDRDAPGAAKCLSFNPKGGTFAVAGVDSIVRIRYTGNPAQPIILQGHKGEVNSLAHNPSGEILASGGKSDGMVILWRATPKAVRDFLCQEGKQLSRDDWQRYIPGIPYFPACP